MTTDARPKLPREWYEPRPLATAAFVAFALGMLFIPGLSAAHLMRMDIAWWWKALGVPPLVCLAGHGVHLTGWVGHEGLHCNLHRNKYVSFTVAILVAAVGTSSVVGHALNHWNHHRYVNTDSDPDAQMYAQYKTFWSRIFGPRSTSHSAFHRYTVLCAFGRELPVGFRLPFPPATARRLAWFGLGVLGLSATSWLLVLAFDPLYGLLGYVVPALLVAGPVSSWRVFAEHADTDRGLWTNSRSYTHWLFTLLFFGNNHHLEHHLYPGVPCYNLPRVHRFLREAGYYARAGSFIDADLAGPLALTRADHFYPQARGEDLVHDPFQADVADHPEQKQRLLGEGEVARAEPEMRHA